MHNSQMSMIDWIKSTMLNTEIIIVNYNTPDLIERLVNSINTIEGTLPIRIIDGSDREPFISDIRHFCDKVDNVSLRQFGYNIHHGRGADYGVSTSDYEYVLLIDSDVTIIKPIIKELSYSKPYEGFAYNVNRFGIDVKQKDILYLHPSLLLIKTDYYKNSEFKFVHHGAPCIEIMANESDENKYVMQDDLKEHFDRGGRGTVNRFGYQL